MKFLQLRDNSLFLQNWRERMRVSTVGSAVILTTIVVGLIFLYATVQKHTTSKYSKETKQWTSVDVPWPKVAFESLAYVQGIILLFFGTLSADKMALREKSSGTLEFHRASPTSRFDQLIGLGLGAPALEWCLFLGTMVPALLLLLLGAVPVSVFIKFYLGLSLCAVFYHALAILLALATSRKGLLSQRRISAVHLLAVFFFLSGIFMYELGLSSCYHLTWFPLYDEINRSGRMSAYYYGNDYYAPMLHNLYSIFGYKLPSLVIQGLTQLPLIIFCACGIMRKISKPEQPVFSKTESAGLSGVILLLFVGSAYSIIFSGGNSNYYYGNPLDSITALFIFIVIGLGIVGTLTATPNRLAYLKGLRKAQKLGVVKLNPSDDHSSNGLWLVTFVVIVTAAYLMLGFAMPVRLEAKLLVWAILVSYLTFFAMAYEYFQLSRNYRRWMFFVTAMILLWIILPVFASIIRHKLISDEGYHALIAPSFLWTAAMLVQAVTSVKVVVNSGMRCATGIVLRDGSLWLLHGRLVLVLIINALLCLLAFLMSARTRRECRSLKD